jgi:hypothetical protein
MIRRSTVLPRWPIGIYSDFFFPRVAACNSFPFSVDQKGTVVEKLTEETLRDKGHLLELLAVCEGIENEQTRNTPFVCSRLVASV